MTKSDTLSRDPRCEAGDSALDGIVIDLLIGFVAAGSTYLYMASSVYSAQSILFLFGWTVVLPR